MGSIAQAVEHHLKMDMALLDTLSRDIASLRRSARWIIQEYDLDATEEAVVSALRRYVRRHDTAPLTRDNHLLAQTKINVYTGLTLFTIPRTPQTQQRIPKAWDTVEARDLVAIWPSHKTYRILTENAYEEPLATLFPPGHRDEIQNDLAAIKLNLPEDPQAIAILGHATAALTHEGIRVHDIHTCLPEAMILVSDDDAVDAYETLTHLTRQEPAP